MTLSTDFRIRLAELEERGGFDGTRQCTVPAAIAAFLRAKDFEEPVRITVSLSGDTDTLACIASAIAEAHFGNVNSSRARGWRH